MTLIAAQRAMLLSNAYLSRHTRYQQNKIILNCIRAFSKYDIVEVQDAHQKKAQEAASQQPPKVESAATMKPQPTLSPSQKRSVEEIAQKLIFAEHSSQMELDDARTLLLRTCSEAQSLLSFDKDEAISSEEIVATADYFLILINDEDIDNSIAKIQLLQGDIIDDEQSLLGDGELLRVVAAMNQLHRVFIAMVDSCIPPMSSSLQNSDNESNDNDDIENSFSYDKEKYSSKTVARALQISRRAEDLGMPLHRPLYKRLAMSVAVTSLGHLDDDAQDNIAKDITPLELPGQFQQIKEGFAPAPIAMELIDLCIRVRVALKIPSPILSIGRDPLEEFAAEILSDPLLLLLKRKQWEEAMSLLEGWREHFGRSEKINLLTMLGEDTTLEALEIVKSWVVKEEFVQGTQASHHALHLTSLLEESLETILDERKRRAAKLSRILPHLIGQLESPPDEEEFDSDGSDSEYEEEFDSDEDDDWEQSDASADAVDTTTMEYKVNADDDEEDVMIAGMSNKDVRSRIYLRNSCDWSIPDVVGQLEAWNKGRSLSFSPAFERYLCQQMMTKEDDEFFD